MITAGFPPVACQATVDDRTDSIAAYNRTEIRTLCAPWAPPQAGHGNPFRFRCVFRESMEPVPGPRRLACSCGISDDGGVGVVLVLVVFGAAIWWQARRKRWGAVRTLVFWLVVLAVLWVLASRYNAGASPGLGPSVGDRPVVPAVVPQRPSYVGRFGTDT
jgi:hypothetical protein